MTQNLPDGFLRRMHTLLGGDFDILFEGYDRSLRRGIRVNTLKYTMASPSKEPSGRGPIPSTTRAPIICRRRRPCRR